MSIFAKKDLYIQKRRSKRKGARFFVFLLILALVIVGVVLGKGKVAECFKGFKKDEFSFMFTPPQGWNAYDNISEINKKFAVGLQYPLIADATNKAIEDDAKKIVDELKKEIKQFKTGSGEDRTVYTANFNVIPAKGGYVSVVYTINRVAPLRDLNDVQYRTRIYNTSTGEAVKSEDIFNENFAVAVSHNIKEFFVNNPQYASETYTPLFTDNTKAKAENFKNFSFGENSILFYFGAGEIFPSDMGAVVASVPISEVFADMKLNITGYTPPKYNANSPMVALTFDDGPYAPSTNRILDALESVGGRATFFVLGDRVGAEKSTITRGDQLGCEYGNHTWNHANLSKLSASAVKQEIDSTNDAVKAITGKDIALLRAPYAEIGDAAGVVGKPFIGWSIDTEDWMKKDPQAIVSAVTEQVKDGDIVLMHDLYPTTAEAAETIIRKLTGKGFQLVTVSELMAAKGRELIPGKVHYHAR